ncbi:MAG: LicD family protein [Megasphaera sp.]|uniref:LicD family protein n=1 Tax=Acidaminococcus sp. TaxID=1872103 RepID=UPI002A75E8CD|nr:LicD family protein [Acidaminococcus sp.]MBS5582978.1 LicD family protein [Megasphaera sp.]MDY2738881.1 LicD family protein [Acidaminococcus sp.]
MKELTLKEIQEDVFQILLTFDQFCKNNHLTYRLAGGTLLGAIRHKGFIPWDDDIDVCMPRPDYEKFLMISKNDFIDKGYEVTAEAYCKISDLNTKLISQYRFDDKYVTMDVFPIDGLPEDNKKVEQIYKETNLYREIYRLNFAKMGEATTFLKRIFKPFFILGARVIGKDYCVKKLNEIAKTRAFENSHYVGAVTWGLYGSGERMKKEEFEETVMVDFEGHKFPTYSCWDSYLHGIYGNYMELPPIEKRKTHHMKVYRLE